MHLRRNLTKTFEESDKEKEETICKLKNIIKTLNYENKKLREINAVGTAKQVVKSFKDMGIQTSLTEPHKLPTSFVLKELTLIKIRQNEMELAIESMKKHNQIHGCHTHDLKSSENRGHRNVSKQEQFPIATSMLEPEEVQVDNAPEPEHKLKEKNIPIFPKIHISRGTQTNKRKYVLLIS